MKKRTIYYDSKGNVDRLTTWINNSRWSWIVPAAVFILTALVEGI